MRTPGRRSGSKEPVSRYRSHRWEEPCPRRVDWGEAGREHRREQGRGIAKAATQVPGTKDRFPKFGNSAVEAQKNSSNPPYLIGLQSWGPRLPCSQS